MDTNNNKIKINNEKMLYELILSKGRGKRTPYFDKCIIDLNKKLMIKIVKLGKNYTAEKVEDMFQYGLYVCLKNYKTFDEKKYDKPFNYFTEVAKRAYMFQINQLNNWSKAQQKDPAKTIKFNIYSSLFI